MRERSRRKPRRESVVEPEQESEDSDITEINVENVAGVDITSEEDSYAALDNTEITNPSSPGKKDKENGKKATEKIQQSVNAKLSARRIKATWPIISQAGQNEIMRVIDSEMLPALHSIRGEKTKQEFQIAHKDLRNRLERKLHKVPVPPSTRKSHYEWDTLYSQNIRLESTLAPMLEQNTHLEREILRETKLLQKDKSHLKTLETNSKSQIQEMKRLGKKAQNMYRVNIDSEPLVLGRLADTKDDVNLRDLVAAEQLVLQDEGQEKLNRDMLVPSKSTTPPVEFQLTEDDSLVPILRELSRHLDKIKAATAPLNAILKECSRLEQEL